MPEFGDLILLVSPKGNRYLFRLEQDKTMHTQEGVIASGDIAETRFGGHVRTHMGKAYRLIRPTLHDLIKGVKRQTQIIYPKEIGYICLKLGIGPGCRVIEAGSGSGGLTVALSWYAGETGTVYTYERRPEFRDLCAKNLAWAGVGGNVEQHCQDIEEGFLQTDVDALFLDVRTPWDYLEQAAAAVAPGAPMGFLLPTTNQVSRLIGALDHGPFADIEVVEILLRRYKPVSDRLRPEDRMVAHTGFLIFARQQDRDTSPKSQSPAEPDLAEPTPVEPDPVGEENESRAEIPSS